MSKSKSRKPKKKMNPETKHKILTGLKTLINNDACVEAGRFYNPFLAVGLAILSVILAVIPTFVSNINIHPSSSILGTSSYNLENQLADFENAMTENLVHLRVDENGNLQSENFSALTDASPVYEEDGTTPILNSYRHVNTAHGRDDFYAFLLADDALVNDFIASHSIAKGVRTAEEGREGETYSYGVNTIVFSPTRFTLYTYARLSTTRANGSFVIYSLEDMKGIDLATAHGNSSYTENPTQYIAEVRAAWQFLLEKGYTPTRIRTAWANTGIFAGIDTGVILLMGLLLFIITRGKKNPYRIFSLWATEKTAYWAAPAPGILALGLGFLLQNIIGVYSFIFLYGLRMMWMTMKTFSVNNAGR